MTRRSSEELRALMLDAGCELVRRRGLAFDPPSLTYANVFEHLEQTRGIKLHRSQVHGRIWENQEAYRLEVVVSTIANTLPGSAEIDGLVADLTAGRDPAELRDIIEAWVEASIGASREGAGVDRRFDLFVAAQALSSGAATPDEIAEAVRSNLMHRMAHNEIRYRTVTERLGAQINPAIGIEPDDAFRLLARTSSALVEGARLLEIVDEDITRPFDTAENTSGTLRSRDATMLGLTLMVEELLGITPGSDAPDESGADASKTDTTSEG